jgi:hypothetical protein
MLLNGVSLVTLPELIPGNVADFTKNSTLGNLLRTSLNSTGDKKFTFEVKSAI